MANKCPKSLGNKGLSGIYAIWENAAATLLQLGMEKAQKGMVASGYEVMKGGRQSVRFFEKGNRNQYDTNRR